ncbi:hypothetical protein L6R52_39380 [Myxococcota bacterium]|nr:hypothetical protein [Myxococcota bacterium]
MALPERTVVPFAPFAALPLTLFFGALGPGCLPAPEAGTIAVLYDVCSPAALSAAVDASDGERASISEAAALWSDLGALELGVLGTSTAAASQVIPIQFRRASLFFLGQYDGDTGEIYVNRSISEPRARAMTIAHELGHAFGLVHVPIDERRSVMNPANVDVAPTAEDAAALGAVAGACGASSP